MIATILVVSSTLYWLLRETDYLRVNLMSVYDDTELLDYDLICALNDYNQDWGLNHCEAIQDYIWRKDYQEWVNNQHAPASHKRTRTDDVTRWEELQKRRQGIGIYTRTLEVQSIIDRG
jgi:hypothetical protein